MIVYCLYWCFVVTTSGSAVAAATSSKLSYVDSSLPAAVSPTLQASTLYSNWLTRLFGLKRTTSPLDPSDYNVIQAGDWTLIDLIKKDAPAFDECFNPHVSGDWSSAVADLGGGVAQDVSSKLDGVDFDLVDVGEEKSHNLGPSEWDYAQLDETTERRSLYLQSLPPLSADTLPSFLETVNKELVDIGLKGVIDRDVGRTLPVINQKDIEIILYAYSLRNPVVGYTQGLNYIVSFFLQQISLAESPLFTNKDVFYLLAYVVEQVNVDYYDTSLSGYHTDLRRIKHFMDTYAPTKTYRIPLEVVLTDAMLTMYIRVFPFASAVALMDFVFINGGRMAMFAVHLAMVDLAWSTVDAAVAASEPGLEIAMGGTEFRLECSRIGASHVQGLIARAEAYLKSHGEQIAIILKQDAPALMRSLPTLPAKSQVTSDESTRISFLRTAAIRPREQPRTYMTPIFEVVAAPSSVVSDVNELLDEIPVSLVQAAAQISDMVGGWWRDYTEVMQDHPHPPGGSQQVLPALSDYM